MAPTKAFKSSKERKAYMQAAAESSLKQIIPASNPLGKAPSPGDSQQQPVLPGRPVSGKLNTPNKKPSGGTAPTAGPAGRTMLPAQPQVPAHANGAAGNGKAHDEYEFALSDSDVDKDCTLSNGQQSAAAKAAARTKKAAPPVRRRKVQPINRVKLVYDEHIRSQGKRVQDAAGHSGDENDPMQHQQTPFVSLLDEDSDHSPTARRSNDSRKGALAAAPHGAAGVQARPQQQQQLQHYGGSRQADIRQFARKTSAHNQSASEALPAGMLNHGNTCYLNAILQALLSLPCLARELHPACSSRSQASSNSSGTGLSQLQLPPDGITTAMQECLRQHQEACQRSGGLSGLSPAAISPVEVRNAMQKRASHWGAARQEDAHEFFTALLHGLSDEVQQAQLEHLKASKGAGHKQSVAAVGAAGDAPHSDAPSSAAAQAPSSTADLPPSADDAAQACQAEPPHSSTAAAAAGEAGGGACPAVEHGMQQQQQEQHQGDKEGTPPPDAAPGAAAQSAPADAGEPPAAAGKAADGGSSARSSRQPTPACQLPSMPVSQTLCPVSRNFLGCLQHTFTCSVCGHKTCVKEQFNHLILDLPADDDSAGGSWPSLAPVADLSSLLANFFAPETCDKACEGCGAAEVQHRLEHAIRRLPRVLVVQLKRFKWLWSASGIPDCRKVPTPVKPDKQLFLGRLCVPGRPVPPLLAELMPQRLLQSAMEAAGEQPLERQQQQQQQEHDQQHLEQPAQQQLFGSIASMGNGSTAPPAAAAVADGALGRLLQDGAADAPTAGVVQGQDQQQDRQQAQQQQQLDRRPGGKRLGSSGNWVLDTHSGLQPAAPKKPKVVAGQQFGSNSSSVPYKGSLANFWHTKHDLGNSKRLQSRPSPLDPSKFSGDWEKQAFTFDDRDAPPPLRRNNSSSAVQRVDLTDLADAAADDEFQRELQAAIALSLQEPQQPAGGPAKQPDQQQQQQQQSPASSTHGSDGPLPDYDSLPDWMDEQHTAAAAAPPASPMDSSPSPPEDIFGLLGPRTDKPLHPNGRAVTTGQDCGAAVDHPATATSPGLNAPVSPAPAAAQHGEGQPRAAVADDSMLGLTPPHDSAAAAAGHHGRAGLLTAMQCDRGPNSPKSPALTAPRPDRSGFVSSSAAPGGRLMRSEDDSWRPMDAATAAAAAAAMRCSNQNALLFKSLSGNASGRDQTLLQEVQAAGLSEDEQLARAIAESMKQQGSGPAAAAAAAAGGSGATAHAADAAGAAEGTKDVEMEDVVVGSDVVEDEDAVMKRVLAESAAEHERHQQQKLQELQQQEEAAAAAQAATAREADAAAAAAAGPAGAAAAGAGSSKERQEEKPPALLLRLLEDSDYEAEQEELQGSSKQQGRRSSSPAASGDIAGRSVSPTADSTAAAAAADQAEGVKAGSLGPEQQHGVAAGGDEGSRPASRRRARGQKPRQQRGASKAADNHKGNAAAADGAAGAAGGPSADIKADGDDADAAAADRGDVTDSMVQGSGLDKENQAEEAAAAEAAAEADTDAVADGSLAKRTKAAAAKAPGSKGRTKPTQQQRKVLGEIFGAGGSSLNAAAGRLTTHAAAAAALDPPHKPPAVAAAVAASRAAAAAGVAAGSSHAPAAAARAATGAEGEVQELQEGVAAGAVGSWPQEAAASYSLTAVVRHMGDLVSMGHFTSDVLNSETKRWYHYDDSRVELLSGIETVGRICQRDGYLFFYVNDAISDK